jgi:hypothetical protein
MTTDEILEKFGLKYEDLDASERETLHSWQNVLSENKLTLDNVRAYISSMRDAVEVKLTKTGHNSKQDLLLKARLRNYMLLESFLSTPEKAKAALERAIAGMVSNRKG